MKALAFSVAYKNKTGVGAYLAADPFMFWRWRLKNPLLRSEHKVRHFVVFSVTFKHVRTVPGRRLRNTSIHFTAFY